MRTPYYSVSQRIGTLGLRVFQGGHPDQWVPEGSPIEGGDFGFDGQMWLESMGRITGRFSIQLKAGANVEWAGGDEPFVSIALRPETCNLYLSDGQPVLLVFIALSSERSSDNASMYYLWIEEAMRERLGTRKSFDDSDPKEMSFRVPIANKLTKQLDITEHLHRHWEHNRLTGLLRSVEGTGALRTVSSLSPRGLSALTVTSSKQLDRWLSNHALSGDNLWPAPKTGTIAANLKQLSDALTNGDLAESDRLIVQLNSEVNADPELRAELDYQRGRRAHFSDDKIEAARFFASASEAMQEHGGYLAAALEAAVANALGDLSGVPEHLRCRADNLVEHDEVKFQLVRLAALEGDWPLAETLEEQLSEPNRTKAQLLLSVIAGDWDGVLKKSSLAISAKFDTRTRLFIRMFLARALLHHVTNGKNEILVGGVPGLDPKIVVLLRDATVAALRDAQSAGWPANAILLLDCASTISVTLGPDRELKELISDFARKRPQLRDVLDAEARVSTFGDFPDDAIDALERIQEQQPEDIAHLVLLLSETGRHERAVELAVNQLLSMRHELVIDMAAVAAATSAYRLQLTPQEHELRNYVASGCSSAQRLLRYISQTLRHPSERQVHLDQLWIDATEGGGDPNLQDNLFGYLRSDRSSDVDRIIELSRLTLKRRNLLASEAASYATALLRQDHYTEVADFTDLALAFYPRNETIGIVRAIALDKQGQTAAAERILRQFEWSDRADLIDTRAQLLLRSGEVDAGIALTRRALGAAADHDTKFHYQRLLATLYSRTDSTEYLQAVLRLGDLARPDVEQEEGIYLLHIVMARQDVGAAPTEQEIEVFQRRLSAFTARFPESKILRVGSISEGMTPAQLIAQLQVFAGVSDAQIRLMERQRQVGENSGSHLPFGYRPSTFAPFARNVVDLLRLCVERWHDGEASRLLVHDGQEVSIMPEAPPIFDLVTVLAFVELDLFDVVFSCWSKVAIPKESIEYLTELMFAPVAVGNIELVDRAVQEIRRWNLRILQPSSGEKSVVRYPTGEMETLRQEVTSGRHTYLSIDAAAAALLSSENPAEKICMTIWPFIDHAERGGALTSTKASILRLRIASWNSRGVPLRVEDVCLAALGEAERGERGDRSASARAGRALIMHVPIETALGRSADVAAKLVLQSGVGPSAASWFLRFVYIEALVTRTIGFSGTADDLTAQLAALSVVNLYENEDAEIVMSKLWSVLEELRIAWGGMPDRDSFFRHVGAVAASLFHPIAKKHGIAAMEAEEAFRARLFTLANTGTQDHEALTNAYFRRTSDLQKQR